MEYYHSNRQFLLAQQICQTLQARGFQALLAGGCVRDFLLHRTPADFDVATSATSDQVEELFEKTLAVGKNFGVIIVLEDQIQVEVATFRKDGVYEDGRRPSQIEFTDAKEDAQRRDFTVNGLFYDLVSKKVLDYVHGLDDLNQQILRAIGNPTLRFKEDQLRLLRAVRFSAQLGFEIESQTLKAVSSQAALIRSVSGERIQEELTKLLISQDPQKGLNLLLKTGLLEALLETNLQPFPCKEIFSRSEKNKEDHWFRFFLWIWKMKLTPTQEFFEQLCDKWKFSRDLKHKTRKSISWMFQERVFLRRPLGELLALSYDSENLRGLMEYSEILLQDMEEKIQFEFFLKRRLALGREKPHPWVAASDMPHLKGEAVGQAIRLCYWEQLEGTAKSKEDLSHLWQNPLHRQGDKKGDKK